MTEASLLDFPCALPVKVLGRNSREFRAEAVSIVHRHYADVGESSVSEQASRNSAYLSLTFVVPASSREEIDALYRELTASDEIMMVL